MLMLWALLDKRPQGRHVRYTRLILAQYMMNAYGDDSTSIKQDVVAAKTEYLWLANNAD
jgi:hypothetical protein